MYTEKTILYFADDEYAEIITISFNPISDADFKQVTNTIAVDYNLENMHKIYNREDNSAAISAAEFIANAGVITPRRQPLYHKKVEELIKGLKSAGLISIGWRYYPE